MWRARVTRIQKVDGKRYQVFGISDHTEFRIDESQLPVMLKVGDYVEGYLAGGAIVATRILHAEDDLNG
jgi:hypothetical protein